MRLRYKDNKKIYRECDLFFHLVYGIVRIVENTRIMDVKIGLQDKRHISLYKQTVVYHYSI
ncbi:25177_t:CDS:2 [Gigaspora rosea]|nr:25177_t:CDS:2 [Gigaspora rosea]